MDILKAKLPPQCLDEENRLIELLGKNPHLISFLNFLEVRDFYREANGEKFQAMICKDSQVEIIRLAEKIKKTSEERKNINNLIEKLTNYKTDEWPFLPSSILS